MCEEWKPVIGFEERYEVSSLGRIRNAYTLKILRVAMQTHGYPKVVLWNKQMMKQPLIHQVVAEAFLGPRPDSHDTDHKDGNRWNNFVDNLRYIPSKENRSRKGMSGRGKTLTEDQVRFIRQSPKTASELAAAFGVCKQTVYFIRRRITWQNVP